MSSTAMSFLVLTLILLAVALLVWLLARENRRLEAESEKATNKCGVLKSRLDKTSLTLSEAVRNSEYYFLASEHGPDGIVVQDMSGRILWSNPAFSKIHGRTARDVLGRHPKEFAMPAGQTPKPEDLANFTYAKGQAEQSGFEVVENQRANGELFWNQINTSFSKTFEGDDIVVQVCRDVTKQIEQTEQLRTLSQLLEHEARTDELTGASNRGAFREYFDEVIDNPDKAPVGVLHIDLDNFKSINDTHGHSAGDAVLVHVTEVLKSCVRPDDMVSRVGGDEFVVTCPRAPDLGFLDGVANKLVKKLAEPFKWGSNLIKCEASVGAAISDDTSSAEDLLGQADFALYEAKRGGRNCSAMYDAAMQNRHETKILRSGELADALNTDALDCYFQPTIELSSGNIIGVEALVRWNHPRDGLIAPDVLLPIAKELGLMAELDLHSMSFALREKQKLTEAGFGDVGVAFNASPELLIHPEFVDRLIWETDGADIDRSHITVEILETTDFGDSAETSSQVSAVRRLHEAGFHVHLDDFGVGFAGLSHLATLHVTGVKIDRSLISDLKQDETSQKIVRKIIELSNDLSLTVIAEGVEDSDTSELLREMGCNIIQGYWLAKPMPMKALHSWLEVRGRQTRRRHA